MPPSIIDEFMIEEGTKSVPPSPPPPTLLFFKVTYHEALSLREHDIFYLSKTLGLMKIFCQNVICSCQKLLDLWKSFAITPPPFCSWSLGTLSHMTAWYFLIKPLGLYSNFVLVNDETTVPKIGTLHSSKTFHSVHSTRAHTTCAELLLSDIVW